MELYYNVVVIFNALACEAALRIIGGRDALKDEFPYVIHLERATERDFNRKDKLVYRPHCSGAAISPEWIITAAHCYNEQFLKTKNYTLLARYNSYFPKEIGNISRILSVFIHPRFNQPHLAREYDIGLFRSKNILIPQYGKISAVDHIALVGYEVNILGFGRTNASRLEKPLQVLNGMFNYCLKREPVIVTTMCVVPLCNVAATICGGDSGGPVVHSSGIVGVNSRSAGDCDEFTTSLTITPGTSASVVSTVSFSIDWIQNVVSNKIHASKTFE